MKVVHINFWDKRGGAAIAANRLHQTMLANGINSKMVVFDKLYTDDTSVFGLNNFVNKFIVSFFNIIESRILAKYRPFIGNFSISSFGLNISNNKIVNEADIIYLHWINNNFISISCVNSILKKNKPTVWFLHDMWPMTGGCHHSFGCIKYQSHCHSCDLLNSNKKQDISYNNLNRKISKIGKLNNLEIIAPSNWLGECAQKSVLFSNKKITVIPNLIDTKIFKPVDKAYARNVLSLPLDKKLILFGADMGTENPYKGWSFLKQALQKINSEYVIVTFGGALQYLESEISLKVINIGRLFDDYSLMLLYNACDVFVIPSLAEAFGQTAVESMSCGTPVVGFNIGGIPDIIVHKKTGYLANYKDADDLREGILWVLESLNYDKISADCRIVVSDKFSSDVIVKKHLDLKSFKF